MSIKEEHTFLMNHIAHMKADIKAMEDRIAALNDDTDDE
jgi:hypothetical protein